MLAAFYRLRDAIGDHLRTVSSPFITTNAPVGDPAAAARWHNEQHDKMVMYYQEQTRLRNSWRRAFQMFWIAFFLTPLLTNCTPYSFIAYRWLPNESFDDDRDEMLASHQVCEGDPERCGEMADVWKDKKTGKIFTRSQFAQHREHEAQRMMYVWFLYGLIGCVAAAFYVKLFDRSRFMYAFVFLVIVDAAVAGFNYFTIVK